MNNPSTNRNLLFIIAALVLTNVAVLAYFLWIKKTPEPRGGFGPRNGITEMLIKDVGFNDGQVAQYNPLKEEQLATIKPIFDEMRKAKEDLFHLLSDPGANDSAVLAAANVIAEKQKTLDLQTFNHFKKVRVICTPEQQPKYDSMVQRMFRKMGKRRTEEKTENKK